MRAAIYCRVSTSAQEDNHSLPTQEAACRKYAAEHGMTVLSCYCEVWSAFTRDRPQLVKMREQIRTGAVDVVIVYATDRLSRSQTDFAIIFDEMQRAGVHLHCVSEPFEDTALGKFIISVRAFAGELEREKIRERTMRGNNNRLARGELRPSNRPLYGYQWNDPARKAKTAYIIDEERSAVVRRIFAAVASGATLRSVARALTAEGVPTANGAASWSHEVVRGMCRHEAYMGVAVMNRYGDATVNGKRKRTAKPAEEHVTLPEGTIPPIVSPELFAAVQGKLDRNKQEASRNNRDPETFLLRAGFVRCGYCGGIVHTAHDKHRDGSPRPSYAVRQQGEIEHHGCPSFSIVSHILDGAVWAKVRELMEEGAIEREIARLQAQPDTTAEEERAIERALAEVERKRGNISRVLSDLDDPDTAAPLVVELKSLAERKRGLEEELTNIAARWMAAQATRRTLDSIRARIIPATQLVGWSEPLTNRPAPEDHSDALDRLNYAQRRDLLAALGMRVTLFRADHEPRYVIESNIPLDGCEGGNSAIVATSCSPQSHLPGLRR